MNDLDKKQWVMRLESSLANFGEAIRIVAFHNPLDPEGGQPRHSVLYVLWRYSFSIARSRL